MEKIQWISLRGGGCIYPTFSGCIIAHCNVFNFHSWVTLTLRCLSAMQTIQKLSS